MFSCIRSYACCKLKISDLWVANQFESWFQCWLSSMIHKSFWSCKFLLKMLLFDSPILDFQMVLIQIIKKWFASTFSLRFSKNLAKGIKSQMPKPYYEAIFTYELIFSTQSHQIPYTPSSNLSARSATTPLLTESHLKRDKQYDLCKNNWYQGEPSMQSTSNSIFVKLF